MIVYELKCDSGHGFEAWFKDSAAFERQQAAGEVLCPACGGSKVSKALMTPNIAVKKAAAPALDDEGARVARAMVDKMREEVEANCDYVGPKFAEEARRIHYGEVGERNIYGEATLKEAKELKDEGVEVAPIPWMSRHDA